MAHKGYTLNYFIEFFKSIPDHRWTEGTEHAEGTVQKCALGHVTSDQRNPRSETRSASSTRVDALANIFGSESNIAAVNDGDLSEVKGATPRGRILKALRNYKRTGSITGKVES